MIFAPQLREVSSIASPPVDVADFASPGSAPRRVFAGSAMPRSGASVRPLHGHAKPQVLLVFQTRLEECAAMLRGIVHYERSHNSWVTFLDDEGRAHLDLRWLHGKPWHGVISQQTTPTLVNACAEHGLPLIDLSDAPPRPGVSKIRPDNVAVGHLGAEYFLERGYRSFAFCGCQGQPASRERREGFVEALALAGHDCTCYEIERVDDLTPFWEGAAVDALTNWVRTLPRRVGVMACNDSCAFQVERAAENAGIVVPEQMGVLGANNDPMRCELANPPLSSVATNSFQAGYLAAQGLDAAMAGTVVEPGDLRVEPLGVVTRKSTDVLAVCDAVVAKALAYIREHACRGINVDEVLKHVLVSRSKLESRFRRHVGRSPQAEIRRVQVARIIQLLLETDHPLVEIAELTGFVHVEYMCVLFKRMTGESPGRYRRKHQVEPIVV